MQKARLQLDFPVLGINRRWSYQNGPKFTTPDALNVRPESVGELRYRGGTRPGLEKKYAEVLGTGNRINMMEYVGYADSGPREQLVAASQGLLYKDLNGVLTLVASAVVLGQDYTNATDIIQKLYIADWSSPTGTIKVFDPSANTLTELVATEGTAPTFCRVCCRFRGRLVVAGDKTDPHQYYMSRVGVPTDFDYSIEDDTSAAVSGGLSEGYKLGEAITALIPSRDMCLMFGCTNSLWLLRGDPQYGGQIDNLSHTVGVVDGGAWCKTPDNIIVFMSHDGLYMSPGGCDSSAAPQSLSRERIPQELLNIDIAGTVVLLEYDTFSRGIHIYLSPRTGATQTYEWQHYGSGQTDSGGAAGTHGSHWYFDWENKGFWRVEVPNSMQPSAIRAARGVGDDQSVVYHGCCDGYVRRYSTEATTDDGTAIDSYLDHGPIGEGVGFDVNCIDEISGTLARGSNQVLWSLRSASGPELAFYAEDMVDGIWMNPGWNNCEHPRLSGSDFFLRLRNFELPWTIERINMVLSTRGKMRG